MKNGDFLSVYGVDVSPSSKNARIKTSQNFSSSTNIYVFGCEFVECSSSSSAGGAIRVSSSSSTKMLVEKSTFYRCKTTGYYSGAISFGTEGNCVLSEICSFECCTTTDHQFQFAKIWCTNSKEYINRLNDSTISRSINDNSGTSFDPYHGVVTLTNNNFSLNNCKFRPCCWLDPTEETTFTYCYNTDSNNTAELWQITVFVNYNGGFEIKFCNIIKNEILNRTAEGGIIYTNRNLTIRDSCILENKATCILYEDSYSRYRYTITVSNCTLDEDFELKKESYVTITNKAKSSFIHALNHLSTGNCEAKYDVVGSLTPNGFTEKRRNDIQTQIAYWKTKQNELNRLSR